MSKSLLEQLPDIVRDGRREAEKILESLEGKHKVGLQTRELVIPNKDTAQTGLFGRNDSQHSTAQHSTAQHSTAQHSTIILRTGTTA